MNAYLHIDQLKRYDGNTTDIQLNDDIRFLYSKQNTVMDGDFTKILYSSEHFTMNGLYLLFPVIFDKRSVGKFDHVNHIRNIHDHLNSQLIQDFCLLERKLLAQYKKCNRCDKPVELSFFKQLSTKQIRVYSESVPFDQPVPPSVFIIKISGVWESHERIGITYKIVELHPIG
jgi:hypothetical protein